MHMYVVARAQTDELNRWKNNLMAQFLPYKTGNGKEYQIPLQIRPIEFLELAFPEPTLNQVLRLVQPYYNCDQYKLHKIAIRKALRLEPMPNVLMPPDFKVNRGQVMVEGVGIKKDRYENGTELI